MNISEKIILSNTFPYNGDIENKAMVNEIDDVLFINVSGKYFISISGNTYDLNQRDYYYIRKNRFKIVEEVSIEKIEGSTKKTAQYERTISARWVADIKIIITIQEKESL